MKKHKLSWYLICENTSIHFLRIKKVYKFINFRACTSYINSVIRGLSLQFVVRTLRTNCILQADSEMAQ